MPSTNDKSNIKKAEKSWGWCSRETLRHNIPLGKRLFGRVIDARPVLTALRFQALMAGWRILS